MLKYFKQTKNNEKDNDNFQNTSSNLGEFLNTPNAGKFKSVLRDQQYIQKQPLRKQYRASEEDDYLITRDWANF